MVCGLVPNGIKMCAVARHDYFDTKKETVLELANKLKELGFNVVIKKNIILNKIFKQGYIKATKN